MKILFLESILALVLITLNAFGIETPKNGSVFFQENKGQICDQNFKPRTDVLFSGVSNGMSYHLTQKGISYQLSKTDSWKEINGKTPDTKIEVPQSSTIYRVDINWIGINQNSEITTGESLEGVTNYYLPQCQNGALNVKSYSQIMYNNIYNGIDLKWYEKNGELEYDFILEPNADANQIQFEIKGATKLCINKKGELEISTPIGIIIEKTPVAFQNNKMIKVEWQLKNNKLGFKIENYNRNIKLVIDPAIRSWGTYYGSTGGEIAYSCVSDASGESYIAGRTDITSTVIATVGAHQTVYAGGTADGFIAKFSSLGVRQWGTFYGGPAFEAFAEIDTDLSGDVFVVGTTASSSGISSAGAHQTAFGGINDGFIVKFNSAGVRQWSTYYGTSQTDQLSSCTVDNAGNLYVVGSTDGSGTAIATVGSHQVANGGTGSNDGFLVKFNSAGVRQWGTFYGGGNYDYVYELATTSAGDIFICGLTGSTNNIASAGSYQATYVGGNEAFIAKFNTSGVRQWGTYYGSTGSDNAYDCAVDPAGNVYLTGSTSSTTGIATVGAVQPTLGGFFDAFLVKFDPAGLRQWGTYYGGTASDIGRSCVVNSNSEVFIGGTTSSTANIAITGAYQLGYGGGTSDGFITKLSSAGVLLYSTYYGGALTDNGLSLDAKNPNTIFFAGDSQSSNNISSATPHQYIFGGGTDAYLVKFFDCANLPLAITGNTSICIGSTTTLTATSSGFTSYTWTPGSMTTVSVVITPTTFATNYTLAAGTSTPGCVYPIVQMVIAAAIPTINIAASSLTICSGKTTTLTASGATTYTWNTGPTTSVVAVSPTNNVTYTVTGAYASCARTKTIDITVNPAPSVSLTSSFNTICTSATGGSTIALTGSPSGGVYSGTSVSGSTFSAPATAGTYTATYTYTSSTNSCTNSATNTITVSVCTGVGELSLNGNINIYPNPNNGEFTLIAPESGTYVIINSIGQTIETIEVKEDLQIINVNGLADGIYYVIGKSAKAKIVLVNN